MKLCEMTHIVIVTPIFQMRKSNLRKAKYFVYNNLTYKYCIGQEVLCFFFPKMVQKNLNKLFGQPNNRVSN